MALWLHLIPQLHRPGAAPRHHQFRAHSADMFAGESRIMKAIIFTISLRLLKTETYTTVSESLS